MVNGVCYDWLFSGFGVEALTFTQVGGVRIWYFVVYFGVSTSYSNSKKKVFAGNFLYYLFFFGNFLYYLIGF